MQGQEGVDFFSEIDPASHFGIAFDLLPGISFFAKNRSYELVAMNENFWRRLEVGSKEEVLGKTDFELFPPALAEQFRKDDREILESGRPLPKLVELFFNLQGLPDWYLTSKLPVKNRTGKVVGVMGISRACGQGSEGHLTLHPALDKALAIIRTDFRNEISVEDLALRSGLSPRQLSRLFQMHLGMSPRTFIIKTRVQAACQALRSDNQSISEIAFEQGFCDQSALTLHFRKHMGTTPLRYRRNHGSAEAPTP